MHRADRTAILVLVLGSRLRTRCRIYRNSESRLRELVLLAVVLLGGILSFAASGKGAGAARVCGTREAPRARRAWYPLSDGSIEHAELVDRLPWTYAFLWYIGM